MEKFIILAGSPNVGKTCTTHKVILRLLSDGYAIYGYFTDDTEKEFWLKVNEKGNPQKSGSVILKKDDKKIVVITYGDTEDSLKLVFDNINFDDYYAIVCCSHATRGRKVFKYFHDEIISKIDLNKTQVIPIHKNFLYGYNEELENKKTAELIIKLLEI